MNPDLIVLLVIAVPTGIAGIGLAVHHILGQMKGSLKMSLVQQSANSGEPRSAMRLRMRSSIVMPAEITPPAIVVTIA